MPIEAEFVPEHRKFVRKLDPRGMLDYTVSWSNILQDGAVMVDVESVIHPVSIAAGMEVITTLDSTTRSTVRVSINTANVDDPAFDPPDGVELPLKLIATDDTGQKWAFTFTIPVVRQ